MSDDVQVTKVLDLKGLACPMPVVKVSKGIKEIEVGQVLEAHSISAGLDYPGVGPEHAYFHQTGLARYESIDDSESLRGVELLARTEGIIPALEPAHGLAWILKEAASLQGKVVVLNLSGRGDKDVEQIAEPHE